MPKSIGIIMDGNRRWAKKRGLSASEGHRKGASTLEKIAKATFKHGVEHLAVYALSTENLQRSKEEVDNLMSLFKFFVEERLQEVFNKDIAFRFVGDLSVLDSETRELIKKAESLNKGAKHFLWIAFSYSGKKEVLEAARACANDKLPQNEQEFKKCLWSADLPDFDLVIRTSGVKRLSNFFPWQSAYAELFFTETLWPDFSEEELLKIFEDFKNTRRNFGK